jgi:hypothetical protein
LKFDRKTVDWRFERVVEGCCKENLNSVLRDWVNTVKKQYGVRPFQIAFVKATQNNMSYRLDQVVVR